MTINRFCSSGLQAVALAADRIRLGEADLMLAGGTEIDDMVPMMGNKVALNAERVRATRTSRIAYGMGITAEKVAEQWKVSREDQDAFALASHQKALAAQPGRRVQGRDHARTRSIARMPDLARQRGQRCASAGRHDEGPRAGHHRSKAWPSCRPVFAANGGSVTAGNSSQMSRRRRRGAAGVGAGDQGLRPDAAGALRRLRGRRRAARKSWASARSRRSRRRSSRPGSTQDQLDWIELNEAFAAQALAVIRDLGLDPAKVNPLGGAIALGHPLGATGAIRTATLVHGLRRRQQKYGMVTMCIGTGTRSSSTAALSQTDSG